MQEALWGHQENQQESKLGRKSCFGACKLCELIKDHQYNE